MEFQQGQVTPTDKVQVGYITTQVILKMMEAAGRDDWKSYMNLMSFLDYFISQYKDSIYEKEMARLGFMVILKDDKGKPVQKQGGGYVYVKNSKNPIDKPGEANEVFSILMRLMQRSNFMPIKVYEGDLYVDVDKEKKEEASDDPVV